MAPILYRHCAVCHHPGAVAPFSLMTYQDAKKRAGLIAALTRKRYMPPWLPDATSPRFQHERRLTAAQIAALARWAAAPSRAQPLGARHRHATGLHIEVTPVNPNDGDELSQALWGKMIRDIRGWR